MNSSGVGGNTHGGSGSGGGQGPHAQHQQGAIAAGAAGGGGSADAALGAAALERVMAAAKAAAEEQQRSAEDQRAVCDLCNVRRADVRGPCGHKYHARESFGRRGGYSQLNWNYRTSVSKYVMWC